MMLQKKFMIIFYLNFVIFQEKEILINMKFNQVNKI